MLKGAKAFQFSSLIEVISTEKCRLYEASATPDSLLFAESFVYGYGILLKVHGWWWGKRRGKNLQGGKVQKEAANTFLISFIIC